ncbi:MAG: hypothetical protein HQL38_11635, partial [Alphaproteobacteria bacterium]|nr:hypothetical protein [Alphaproteobacteria bacterium]
MADTNDGQGSGKGLTNEQQLDGQVLDDLTSLQQPASEDVQGQEQAELDQGGDDAVDLSNVHSGGDNVQGNRDQILEGGALSSDSEISTSEVGGGTDIPPIAGQTLGEQDPVPPLDVPENGDEVD